jgi:predicted CXXCH cytochrome family protein
MKRRINFKIPVCLAAIVCSATIMACANQGGKGTAADAQKPVEVAAAQPAEQAEAAAEKAAPAQAEQQAAEAPLYKEIPRSLSPVECASCHNGQYVRLQQSNSKHRFECTDCHDQLHAYIPSKNNYKDIIPKCSNCHDLPHGEAFPGCSKCHEDPHSPLNIPFSGVEQKIKNKAGQSVVACSVCHFKEGDEMNAHPCKHNVNVGCTGCHADKHGVRPTCFDCHEPHVAGQSYADCLVCHAPHSAKNILPYPEEISNTVCASCHTKIYDDLQANHTKHTDLQCASCHVTHGQIPKCQKCHGEPHGAALHKRFPNCLECHVDPHNLPVNPQA